MFLLEFVIDKDKKGHPPPISENLGFSDAHRVEKHDESRQNR